MTEHPAKASKPEARARFLELERQGQLLADVEQKKFAIYRHALLIYRLARIEDLSYQDRIQIVRRIKPRKPEQLT
jgi:hypothetical protein